MTDKALIAYARALERATYQADIASARREMEPLVKAKGPEAFPEAQRRPDVSNPFNQS